MLRMNGVPVGRKWIASLTEKFVTIIIYKYVHSKFGSSKCTVDVFISWRHAKDTNPMICLVVWSTRFCILGKSKMQKIQSVVRSAGVSHIGQIKDTKRFPMLHFGCGSKLRTHQKICCLGVVGFQKAWYERSSSFFLSRSSVSSSSLSSCMLFFCDEDPWAESSLLE